MGREINKGKEANQALIDNLTKLKEEGKIVFKYTINKATHRIEKLFLADVR
jgi:hypothetical protein